MQKTDAWDLAAKDTTFGWCSDCKTWVDKVYHVARGSWHLWCHMDCGGEVILIPAGLGKAKDALLEASARDLARQIRHLRSVVDRIEKIAAGDDNWPRMIGEVRAILAEVE